MLSTNKFMKNRRSLIWVDEFEEANKLSAEEDEKEKLIEIVK